MGNILSFGTPSPGASEYEMPMWQKVLATPFIIVLGIPFMAIAVPLAIVAFIIYRMCRTEKYVFACNLEDFDPKKKYPMKRVSAGGKDVLVCKVDDEYYAINNTCPHAGGTLSEGSIIPDLEEINGEPCDPCPAVVCPLHHWVFRLRDDGEDTDSGQDTYETQVEGKKLLIKMECWKWNN